MFTCGQGEDWLDSVVQGIALQRKLGSGVGLRFCSLPIFHQVFTLPKVSAKTKFKLTAHEGCRVRKVALATFASVACEDYAETCLACLTNLGDVHVFSVPGLRPQVHYSCIRKEDISGIASCVFTRHGQGEAGGVVGRERDMNGTRMVIPGVAQSL